MGKQTKNQILLEKYRWEFLRRNREYISDWEFLKDDLMEEYGYDLETGSDGETPVEELDFCNKWNIYSPLDPRFSYDEYTRGYRRTMSASLEAIFQDYPPMRQVGGYKLKKIGGRIESQPSEKLFNDGELTIIIDLNYSKKKLREEFNRFLDYWKAHYERLRKDLFIDDFCKTRNISSPGHLDETTRREAENLYKKNLKRERTKFRQKLHFDNFDSYLVVYDLRQEGRSWSKIVRAGVEGVNSIQNARDYFRAAHRLIEEEFPITYRYHRHRL